jgi:hypothetical protein
MLTGSSNAPGSDNDSSDSSSVSAVPTADVSITEMTEFAMKYGAIDGYKFNAWTPLTPAFPGQQPTKATF